MQAGPDFATSLMFPHWRGPDTLFIHPMTETADGVK
jgi:hypothetical protein